MKRLLTGSSIRNIKVGTLFTFIVVVGIGIYIAGQKRGDRSLNRINNLVGRKIVLPGINWGKSNKSILVGFTIACKSCFSHLFHQQLSKLAFDNHITFVVVSQQKKQEVKDFLEARNFVVDEIVEQDLNSLGILGSPTLLILDKNGTVTDCYLGDLSQDQQSDLLETLGL